ncbi:MAG TPA: MaoC/PaaZ C-terminal domain-containing protein [Polyangiales bacterium]
MPIDLEIARNTQLPTSHGSWNADQVILYHLGVGAAQSSATDPKELEYAYEAKLKVLPSFGVTPAFGAMAGLGGVPGLRINYGLVLHGEQDLEVHRPLPTAAQVESTARIAGIYDKGKAALIVIEVETRAGGERLFTNRYSIFARGEGGFGGDPGPKPENQRPDRAPDLVVESTTLPHQALLYRLSGDKNPLHADPTIAKLVGFDRPILHGLCSYGIVCKAVVDAALGGDVTAVARYQARFAGVVFPGETLVTSMWRQGDKILIEASTKERKSPVISHAAVTLRAEPQGGV